MQHSRTHGLVTSALVAALLAASAYVSVPIQPVPLTFQTFVVVLAALVLPPGGALAALGTYLLLGLAGVPVFAGGQAGLGVLVGPTGGYLTGFLVAATFGALLLEHLRRTTLAPIVADAVTAAFVVVVVFACGATQLAAVAGLDARAAVLAGVAPFVLMDAVKAAVAVAVAVSLRRAGVAAVSPRRA